MDTIISLIMTTLLLAGAGCATKKLLSFSAVKLPSNLIGVILYRGACLKINGVVGGFLTAHFT